MIKTFTLTVILFIICFSSRVHSQDDKVQPSKRSILGRSSSANQWVDPWIGKRVVLRYQDVHVRYEGEALASIPVYIHVSKVIEVNKTLLYIQSEGTGFKAWVRAEDIITLSEGIDFFSREIKIKPWDSWNYFMLSLCWEEMGKHDSAMWEINKAIRVFPDDSGLHQFRGKIWNEMKEYDNAISDFSESIRLSQHDNVALNTEFVYRSIAYSDMKKYDEALSDANNAIQIYKSYSPSYMVRGRAWSGKGEYAKAITDFDKAIELDPYFVEAYYQRGHTFSIMDQKDKAIVDYKKAVHLDPRHAKAKHELHDLLFSLFPPQNPRL
jgi:tetratricopeptide (TPR) repeat protein